MLKDKQTDTAKLKVRIAVQNVRPNTHEVNITLGIFYKYNSTKLFCNCQEDIILIM